MTVRLLAIRIMEVCIPQHITGLYVFAVINLLALLHVRLVEANIVVKNANETAATFLDMPAGFGPDFPDGGLEGRVVMADPPHACGPIKEPPAVKNQFAWIVLIKRGQCQFADKVIMAQNANFSAAIIQNYPNQEGRTTMGGKNGSYVTIPATFVGWSTGRDLSTSYNYQHREYTITIEEDNNLDFKVYLWPFATVVAVCFLIIMVFLVIKFIRDQTRARVARLSKKHLKKIPIRKYKKGEYYDTCAICLDEYEEGEKIRVLPCSHVYHSKCIDPWLTKSKKTCPVCKRRVIPGRSDNSESESDEESGGRTGESTPLLGGASAQPSTSYGHNVSSGRHQGAQDNAASSDHEPLRGAVGGVGISDRMSIQNETVEPVVDVDADARRERRERRRRQRSGPEAAAREEEEAEEARRRDRKREKKRKMRKQKKKEEEEAALKAAAEEEEEEQESSVMVNAAAAFGQEAVGGTEARAKTPQARVGVEVEQREKEKESYINPSYSESQEVNVPGTGRKHEMSEVV